MPECVIFLRLHALTAEVKMKKSWKTLVAILVLGFSFGFTACSMLNDDEMSDIQKENARFQQKISALEATFDSSTSESVKAAKYAELFAELCELTLDNEYLIRGEYPETFKVTSTGTASYNTDAGSIVKLIVPKGGYFGVIAIIKTSDHSNWYPSCYGDDLNQNQNATPSNHGNCYLGYYVKNEGQTFKEAATMWTVPGKSYDMTCATSLDNINYLFNNYGYAKTCAGYSSTFRKN